MGFVPFGGLWLGDRESGGVRLRCGRGDGLVGEAWPARAGPEIRVGDLVDQWTPPWHRRGRGHT
jgi:hypothetical protein